MSEFGFKELIVWQKAMEYTNQLLDICEKINGHYRLVEQKEVCSISVPLNNAEGKGGNSLKEFIHFLHIARGSLYESVTLLNIFQKRPFISDTDLQNQEQEAIQIVKMLNALISSKRKQLNTKS